LLTIERRLCDGRLPADAGNSGTGGRMPLAIYSAAKAALRQLALPQMADKLHIYKHYLGTEIMLFCLASLPLRQSPSLPRL